MQGAKYSITFGCQFTAFSLLLFLFPPGNLHRLPLKLQSVECFGVISSDLPHNKKEEEELMGSPGCLLLSRYLTHRAPVIQTCVAAAVAAEFSPLPCTGL